MGLFTGSKVSSCPCGRAVPRGVPAPLQKKKGASCEPFEKHGYAAPVLVTFGGTCVQVKAAIPVPAHLGRAGRLRVPTRCEPALLRTCIGGQTGQVC